MIDPTLVHEVLDRYQLADGLPVVLDLARSEGAWILDARTGERYLDAFTCFASWPLGYNHPGLSDRAFLEVLSRAAQVKPSNSDLYTVEMAAFVEAFATRVTPPAFGHHFWVSGGALAVENALKTAFDWKARKIGRTSFHDPVEDLVILHFEGAFHGRSGYTLSLTNTLPDKVGLFPKFKWPRVHSPAIVFDLEGGIANDIEAEERRTCAEIESALQEHAGKVAAIIIEPMQGEGGDRHFRAEFVAKLRQYADEAEALLIFDEVQTGFFGSGKPWLWQHHGVHPDVVAFGKKSQVCGIYAGDRVDEVPDNVFRMSSRINSTWGGNLVDMVRARRMIEIIESDNLTEHVARVGRRTVDGLRDIARDSGAFSNVRGIGTLVAFSFDGAAARDRMVKALFDQKVLALPCGVDSVRFRLPMTIQDEDVDVLLERTASSAAVPA